MTTRELHPPSLPVDLTPARDRSAEGEHARGVARGAASARLRGIIDRHYDFVWRTVRYMGVEDASVEDAVQHVLCILARRLDGIAPGAETSFLFSTAVRVASESRRAARRRPPPGTVDVDDLAAAGPSPEDLVDERLARDVLRDVLQAIPTDARMVFVLFEIEELTLVQIAAIVGIPVGTAASRLRRARSMFEDIVRRRRAAGERARRGCT